MTGRTKRTIAAVLLFVQSSIPFALSQSAKRPAPSPFPTLTQRPIEREIRSGEVHTYSFELDSGKSAEIRADQTTVDISLRLFGPDGRELAVVNNVPGLEAMEVVPVTAKFRTRFRLEVRPSGTGSGLYMIRLAEPRTEVVSAKKPVEESVVIGPVGSADELLVRLIDVRDEQAATKLVDENRRFFNLALVFARPRIL